VRRLAEAGATLIGPEPSRSPSLAGFPEADQTVRVLAAEIWPESGKPGERRIGKGRVLSGMTFEQIFVVDALKPDFHFTAASGDADIRYIHRILPEGSMYFVSNLKDRTEEVTLDFRTTGRQLAIWDPVTGAVSENVLTEDNGTTTSITLTLQSHEALFFLFLDKEQGAGKPVAFRDMQVSVLASIEAPWSVTFPPEFGGPPEAVTFDKLAAWNEHPDDRIKHFSGTASYRKSIRLDAPKPDTRLILDLGNLPHLAEVVLNGKNLGVVWMKPAQIDITSAVKPGNNDLEIRVTNVWKNRLVGDAKLEPAKRITWSNWPFYKGNEPLEISGLLGPVTLLSEGGTQ
jgi:hypothetical protein